MNVTSLNVISSLFFVGHIKKHNIIIKQVARINALKHLIAPKVNVTREDKKSTERSFKWNFPFIDIS